MPRYIVKLSHADKDYYLEWSTVVDAPITNGMSLDRFKDYYKRKYGTREFNQDFARRMERVEQTGCSGHDCTIADLADYNRAGPNETQLTLEEIIKEYCLIEELK